MMNLAMFPPPTLRSVRRPRTGVAWWRNVLRNRAREWKGRRIGGERSVQHRDDLRAFADRRGNALHRSGAHVADRENAGATCLQEPALLAGIGAGQDETLAVQRDARSRKPIGIRLGADEQKQMANRPAHFRPGLASAPSNGLEQPVASLEAGDRRLRQHLDVGEATDTVRSEE